MLKFAGVCLMFVVCCAGALRAQSINATVTGLVYDPSKADISGANVTLINVGTNLRYQGMTNETGSYYITNIPAGLYRMEVEKLGFKTVIKPDIILHVQDALELNFEMSLGSVSETITVAAGAPTVQLTTSGISEVVVGTTIREIPLNGRSWTDLAALQPGVNVIVTQPSFTSGVDRGVRGFGSELSISGARPQENNYRFDGVSMNDYANGGPGSVLGGNLGVDAVTEFSVLTTNYSAEYGKTAGGVVNAISRSGTNQFHGSAYEFVRNSALDARNYFDVGTIPPFQRNQFGVAAGGPIRKNRTFIFGDYEGIRQSKGISVLDIVPTQAARGGNLCSDPGTPPSCTPHVVPVDPAAQKYLPLYPLPNGGLTPGGGGDTGFFTFAGNQIVNENFFTTRIDHKLSDRDSAFGSYMFDRAPFTAPDAINNVLLHSLTMRQLFTLEETHTFNPHLLNTVRFGLNRESVDNDNSLAAINPAAKDPSLSAQPGLDSAQVVISGNITPLPAGLNATSVYKVHWTSFQGYDDASLTHGNHSLKFGVAVERMQLNALVQFLRGGQFNFNSFSDFLTNQPRFFASAFPNTLSPRNYRQTLFGTYVQDDWRWRPNLTINLGLRYEMVTVPTEVSGKLVNLINITDTAPHLGSPLFNNPTLYNFEPRVGFAWDPFGNGKTAVRGGFGMFDLLPLIYQFSSNQYNAAPFALRGGVSAPTLPPGSFFAGAAPFLQVTSLSTAHIDDHPKRDYVMQWNLNVQQEITPSLTSIVAYVGSRGVHLPFEVDDLDMVLPKLTSAGYVWPSPIGSGTRLNPNFGGIGGTFYMGNSFYDALEVGVTKRMSHGFQLQTSFTWGKSIDNNSATIQGDQFTNGITSLNWFDPRLTRGLSDFNVGRTLVINGIWQIPAASSFLGPANWLAKGWELGAIFRANDGVPFTPTWATGGDPAGTLSSDPYAFPNRLTGPGCQTLVNPGNPNNYIKTQCFTIPTAPTPAFYAANCDPHFGTFPQCFNLLGNAGRNILPGPGLQTLDFTVHKNNYIKRFSETLNLQLRAEFFNILNRANFGVPNTHNGEADIFDATGAPVGTAGHLTTTTTTAREIQFAVKVIW